MCQAYLDSPQERIFNKYGKAYDLPVFYFTELLGLALGHPQVKDWLAQHLVNPLPLLQQKGLR